MATARAQLDGFIAKDSPEVKARARSGASLQAGKRGAVVIKSIAARQRPRRPGQAVKKK